MYKTQTNTPRHESIISICLLAALCIIGLSVVLRQFNLQSSVPPDDVDSKKDAEEILKPLISAGFKSLSEIDVYNPDNLYEKINGKAPLYLESGFVKLYTRWYINSSNEDLKFQLYFYDMAEPQNAFSVFSTQRRPDAQTFSLFEPTFGYKTENALFFNYGKFYIELIGTAQSDELFKAMAEFAEKIKRSFPAEKQIETIETKLLSGPNFAPGSIKLYLANALGSEDLTNTFTAQLKINNEKVTIFLSKRPGEQNAKQLINSYGNFLISLEATEKQTSLPLDSARVFDFFGTTEIIFNNGPFLAGIHEADNLETAVKAASLLNQILTGEQN